MGMRGSYQSNSLHILSGIAVRLGRRMGLHRDGTLLRLSPFETEMRRRLWWHIVHVDWRTSDFSGTKPSMDLFLSDTKKPLNIEDDDIDPDMTDPPADRTGITTAALCLLRCDLMDFLRKMTPPFSNDVGWDSLASGSITLAEKENMISQMEDLFERKYLRYYDPSTPLHCFLSLIARSSVCKMKIFAHNPRQFANCGAKVPQKSRDIILANSTKLLEYASLAHSNPLLRRFAWQINSGYLWDTIHYVLVEIRHRKTGPEVDHAWQLVSTVFANYPQMFSQATDALYAALGNWTLRVWDELVIARKMEGLPDSPTPEFITAIRRCRRRPEETSSINKPKGSRNIERPTTGISNSSNGSSDRVQSLTHDENPITTLEATLDDSYDFPNLLSFDLQPDEWMQWDRLFSGQKF